MKKIALVLALVMVLSVFAGCGKKDDTTTKTEDGKTVIEKLNVAFVPSRDPDEIVTATEPLKDILKNQLAKRGFEVKEVNITVGTSYEAVGEAMSAGTVDVGFIPGGTYVLYDDSAEVILTATRKGVSVESTDPKEWNDNKPTTKTDEQVTFYRSLFIAGPSEKGRAVAAKVNAGEKLTWEDMNSLNWSVMGSSSSSGYIYPYLYLRAEYGKAITDLANVVQADSYGSSMARLASEQVDVLVCYADARMDNVEKWTSEFGRTESIWDETNVIAVTDKVYNDTISVSKNSSIMSDEFKKALTEAFIEIGESTEGKEVIKIYNHDGYQKAKPSDYDSEREAQKLLRELKEK
ncbi:MAG: phosphate/phosphite/phosphonate ABC transporter substrate-binding protein [Tissierellia bacterium]|nr:phosphate/phosphite/phosphonate ABC transporter substrate-binding protein [Tissierellia bacterium]